MVSNSLRYSINSHESSSQVCDGLTLAGDASHPLTPNIGQGACCTLEDANVLWQKLFAALNLNAEMKTKTSTMYFVDEDGNLQQRIDTAFLEFQAE
jgi:2-polyprenyl-6-methoxyphenol hydroxylase-like FAD-dependent oxidoreductase